MSSTPIAHRALIARSKLRYGTVTYIRPDGRSAGAYSLTKTKFSIGRSEERDIRVRSKEASGEHCILTVDEETQPFCCFITDLSANGTTLNGRWLQNGIQVPLNDGDLIGIGIARFRFNSLSQVNQAQCVQIFQEINRHSKVEQTEMNGFLEVISQAEVAASMGSTGSEANRALDEPSVGESPTKPARSNDALASVSGCEPCQMLADAVLIEEDCGQKNHPPCAGISYFSPENQSESIPVLSSPDSEQSEPSQADDSPNRRLLDKSECVLVPKIISGGHQSPLHTLATTTIKVGRFETPELENEIPQRFAEKDFTRACETQASSHGSTTNDDPKPDPTSVDTVDDPTSTSSSESPDPQPASQPETELTSHGSTTNDDPKPDPTSVDTVDDPTSTSSSESPDPQPASQPETELIQRTEEVILSMKKRGIELDAGSACVMNSNEERLNDGGCPLKRIKLSILEGTIDLEVGVDHSGDENIEVHSTRSLSNSEEASYYDSLICQGHMTGDTKTQSENRQDTGNEFGEQPHLSDLINSPALLPTQILDMQCLVGPAESQTHVPTESKEEPDLFSEEERSVSAKPENKTVLSNARRSLSFSDPLDGPRRVSFGPPLSPEIFDRELPPDTPVKRGQRVSSHHTPVSDHSKLPASPLVHLSTSRRRFVLKSALKRLDRSIPPLILTTDQVNPFVIRPGKPAGITASSSSSSEMTSPVQSERTQTKLRLIPFKYGVPTAIERARTRSGRATPMSHPVSRGALRLVATEPRKRPSSIGRTQISNADFNKKYLKELEDQTDGIIKEFALKLKRSKTDQEAESISHAGEALKTRTKITPKKFDLSQFRFQKSTTIGSFQQIGETNSSIIRKSYSSDQSPTPSEQDSSHEDGSEVGASGGISSLGEMANDKALDNTETLDFDLDLESQFVQYPEADADVAVDAILNQELVVAEGATIEAESIGPAENGATNDSGVDAEREPFEPTSISVAEETVVLETSEEEALASMSLDGLVSFNSSLNEEVKVGAGTVERESVIAFETSLEDEGTTNANNLEHTDRNDPSVNEQPRQTIPAIESVDIVIEESTHSSVANNDDIDASLVGLGSSERENGNVDMAAEMSSTGGESLGEDREKVNESESVGDKDDLLRVDDVSIFYDNKDVDFDPKTAGTLEDMEQVDEKPIRSEDPDLRSNENTSGASEDEEPSGVEASLVSVDRPGPNEVCSLIIDVARGSHDSAREPYEPAQEVSKELNDIQAGVQIDGHCITEQERTEELQEGRTEERQEEEAEEQQQARTEEQLDEIHCGDSHESSDMVPLDEISVECIEDLERAVSYLLEGGNINDDAPRESLNDEHSKETAEKEKENFTAPNSEQVNDEPQPSTISTDEVGNNSIGIAILLEADGETIGLTDGVSLGIEPVPKDTEDPPMKRKRGRPRKAAQLDSQEMVELNDNEQQPAYPPKAQPTKRGRRRMLDDIEAESNIYEHEADGAQPIKRSRAKSKRDDKDENENNPGEPSKASSVRGGKRGRVKDKDDDEFEQDENIEPVTTGNPDEPQKAAKIRGGKRVRTKEKDVEVERVQNIKPTITSKKSASKHDMARSEAKRTRTVTVEEIGETSPVRTYNFRKRK
ncbi:hypothetical protein BJ742DRAFT_800123 [Cladochytrium replicatum]|nr:hypothetical protein BJ742DRAFT_800123 [Cladochytrium replicatum]